MVMTVQYAGIRPAYPGSLYFDEDIRFAEFRNRYFLNNNFTRFVYMSGFH